MASSSASVVTRDSESAVVEATFDAHLEVYAIDTGNVCSIAYRSDERFACASTNEA